MGKIKNPLISNYEETYIRRMDDSGETVVISCIGHADYRNSRISFLEGSGYQLADSTLDRKSVV